MEHIKCIFCDIDDAETILYSKDIRYKTSDEIFKIVKCKNCGLIYLNPRPSKKEIGNFYPSNYRTRTTLDQTSINKRIKKYSIKHKFFIFKNPWYLSIPENTKVLDIGCGSGELMLMLKKKMRCLWYRHK